MSYIDKYSKFNEIEPEIEETPENNPEKFKSYIERYSGLSQEQYDQPETHWYTPITNFINELPEKINEYALGTGDESTGETAVRTAMQIPKGLARTALTGANTILDVSAGGAKRETLNELEDLKDRGLLSPKKYEESVKKVESQDVEGFAPTLENLSRLIEHTTGIPTEAKTKLQKDINSISEIFGFTKGAGYAKGLMQAGTSTAISRTAKEAGVPEPVADIAGVLVGPKLVSSVVKEIKSPYKPSGMTIRGYETRTTPKAVSPGKLDKIKNKVSEEFEALSENIRNKNETHRKIAEDFPKFKQDLDRGLEEVERMADELPGSVSSEYVKDEIKSASMKKPFKGIAKSEYEKKFEKEIGKHIKDLPKEGNFSVRQRYDQYRKNNKSLGDYFEPGMSSAENKAKRDALLTYNESIANSFEKTHPNSPFSKYFKSNNKLYHDMRNVQDINEFVSDISKGKIDYKLAKKYMEPGSEIPYKVKSTYGAESEKAFSQLVTDLMSTERSMMLLKPKIQGLETVNDLVSAMNPFSGAHRLGKATTNFLLDNPALMIEWSDGLKAAKRGSWDKAVNKLKGLKNHIKEKSFSKSETLGSEKISNSAETQYKVK